MPQYDAFKDSEPVMTQYKPGLESAPRHFHRRHSLLSASELRNENPMESITFPASQASQEDLSPVQPLHEREPERSGQQDDNVMTNLKGRGLEDAAKRRDEDRRDVEERGEEKHILRGGWMHRSRASCELLRDHKDMNVGGD